jgi:hypothetical protein
VSAVEAAPDYAEALEAWRVWRVAERRGRLLLGSVIKETEWLPGDPVCAACLRRRTFWPWGRRQAHDAPEESCECGIYGTALEHVERYVAELASEGVPWVVGRVALWGTLVICERGYRASRAYPVQLFVTEDAGDGLRLGAGDVAAGLDAYKVPVELLPGRGRGALAPLAPLRTARRST